jgi:iduronate 2-sulfatase
MKALAAVAMVLLGAGVFGRQPAPAPADRVNVLLIVSDDLNNDLGCYRGPARTPNIDKLAARGMRFDRAYCQFPLCNPSRSSFLTGRKPDATKVLANPTGSSLSPNIRESIPDTVTLPQRFKTAGWMSARVGKLYHYGVPLHIGTSSVDDFASWDITVNPRGRDREVHDRIFSLVPGTFGATLSWLAEEGADAEHTDGIGALEAVKLLERFASRKEAFFLGVGFYRPHTPYVAPKKYFDMYPPAGIALPEVSAADRARQPALAFRNARKEQDEMTDAQRREAIQAYLASISFMDAQVGVVLSALDRLKLADRTVVVFMSDHGYHLGDHGLWQKMSLFERSVRVPLIIAAPNAKARGGETNALAELVDLYPTLARLANLSTPEYLDGVSLTPVLDDPRASVRDAAYTQIRNDGYAIRTDRWRYIEWAEGKEGSQLYDMSRDPGETTNLAADPQHAATVADLRARLGRYGASAPKPAP